jgi:sialic acid synthase SpsE
MKSINLKYKKINEDSETYFIADIAANHDGDLQRAKELIYLAKEAGADCAKFQHFKAKNIVSASGFLDLDEVRTHQSEWKKPVDEIYDQYHTRVEWDTELIETCKAAQIEFMTTPYDLEAVKHYSQFCSGLKIGSGDITFHQIIEEACRTNLPIFLATGASNLYEVEMALQLIKKFDNPICLLQCNTNYTGDVDNFNFVNLNVLKQFANSFPDAILGLSDHTPGHAAVLGAVTLGARVIEKHFTDDTTREGPDHKFALDKKNWKEMVNRTRELEFALGDGIKRIEENEKNTVIVQRRAIRAARNLPAGTVVQASDLKFLRPCPSDALNPFEIEAILGKPLKHDMLEDQVFKK